MMMKLGGLSAARSTETFGLSTNDTKRAKDTNGRREVFDTFTFLARSRTGVRPWNITAAGHKMLPRGRIAGGLGWSDLTARDRSLESHRSSVGGVAQLGERIHGMDEVRGSSP